MNDLFHCQAECYQSDTPPSGAAGFSIHTDAVSTLLLPPLTDLRRNETVPSLRHFLHRQRGGILVLDSPPQKVSVSGAIGVSVSSNLSLVYSQLLLCSARWSPLQSCACCRFFCFFILFFPLAHLDTIALLARNMQMKR